MPKNIPNTLDRIYSIGYTDNNINTKEDILMECHGCRGKGWVDSQYKGAMICPICLGSGKVVNGQGGTSVPSKLIPTRPTLVNKNSLLLQLEEWLQQRKDVKFGHISKTMNTYNFMSKSKGRMIGLVWVSTDGSYRIPLFKGDYGSADPNNRVKYQNVWGGYPQFEVRTQRDVEYAKKLISYALENF